MEALFGPESVAAYDAEPSAGNDPRGQSGALHPLLVPLKADGALPPLFMIHPPGGIVVCYRDLARHLPAERPLYGLRSRGLHGHEALPATLAAMAAEYVTAIRTRQPEGPYLLGGWSLGGVIAAEVARQLVAAGEGVDRLLLLDSAIPESALPAEAGEERFHAGREYGLDFDLAELAQMEPEAQLPFLFEHARKLGLIDEATPPELVHRVLGDLRTLFAHHVTLCQCHQPQWCPVDGVVFRPMEVPFDRGGPEDRGWSRFLRSVEVVMVPGHHHSMVALPHAVALAAAIDAALAGPIAAVSR